jgi:hypothetical protein
VVVDSKLGRGCGVPAGGAGGGSGGGTADQWVQSPNGRVPAAVDRSPSHHPIDNASTRCCNWSMRPLPWYVLARGLEHIECRHRALSNGC